MWISSKQPCAINLLSDGIPDAYSSSNSDTISATIPESVSDFISDSNPDAISEAISESIPDSIPKAIPEAIPKAIPESNSNHSNSSAMLQEAGVWQWLWEAVGEHLSSRYVAQVDLSDSSHSCSKTVLGRNVCNSGSGVDSVLDTRDH
jgi:hypothetical protein